MTTPADIEALAQRVEREEPSVDCAMRVPHPVMHTLLRNDLSFRILMRGLARMYIKDALFVANLCDGELDRSGALLGYVRDEAAALRAHARSTP